MILQTLTAAALLFAAVGSTPDAERAAPNGDPANALKRSIAVISGQNRSMTLHVVDILTEELRRQSGMDVLSSGRIRAKAADYPFNIQGPFTEQNFQTDVDHKKTDVKLVRKIKEQLGVDYLYVVWLSESLVNPLHASTYRFQTQLFAGPSGTLVSSGELESVTGSSHICLLVFIPPSPEKKQHQLQTDCEQHVRQLLVEIDRISRPSPT